MPTNWKKIDDLPKADQAKPIPQSATPEMERLENFEVRKPQRCLEDLIVSESIVTQIQTTLNRIRYHDTLYNTWNLKKIDPYGRRTAINFFGPPGTGKTFCAEAIAHHLGKSIITVNYAEIESKYVGETPKNITAAFKKAKETDAVLFFDEADSILGKRLTSVTQSADHGVNVSRSVMLLQLDDFDGVIIFASNLPENYDGAFVRRILAHIEFELPDQDCRKRLWNYLLPTEVPRSPDTTAEWLAAQSEGLAGGDILNVVKLAASQAVVRCGEQCQVFRDDFLAAIAQVRRGKEKVGNVSVRKTPPVIKETVLSPDELSPELRDRYEESLSQPPENNSQSVT